VQTIGIPPLVELKKTQRLEDYPIISKLALAWFGQPECRNTEQDLCWAMDNLFTLPELRVFFAEHPEAAQLPFHKLSPLVLEFGRQLIAHGDVREDLEQQVIQHMQGQMTLLQLDDRRYWRKIVSELRQFRTNGLLLPEGQEV